MNPLVVLSAIVASASAQYVNPNYYGIKGYNLAPVAAPVVAAAAPVPYSYPSSQYQAQDEFGNINYGYSNVNSAKQEVGNVFGGVTGSYSYVDANGIQQRVDYIADHLGYRVKATNLPVQADAPAVALPVAPVYNGVAPVQVEDTPEVKAAKAEFQAAFDEAASRNKRESEAAVIAAPAYAPYAAAAYPYAAYGNAYAAPWAYNGLNAYAAPWAYNGYAANYGYAAAAPVAYAAAAPAVATAPVVAAAAPALTYASAPAVVASAPAVREAVKTVIKNNPGFAVSYRVD